MTTYPAESFFRAKINASILKATACPMTVPLSKLPSVTNGLLTMSPNSEYEEICEYNNPNPTTMTIDIIKRWIKPSSLLLTTNGIDYNNTLHQFDHTQNDIIRGDVNHIHLNQGIGNTTLATNLWVGISKLSVAAVAAWDPIVVGDNDTRLIAKTDATISVSDVTTNNVSISAHWWAPKLPNDSTKFLNWVGSYVAPNTVPTYSLIRWVWASNWNFTVTAWFQPKIVRVYAAAWLNSAPLWMTSSTWTKTSSATWNVSSFLNITASEWWTSSDTSNIIFLKKDSGSAVSYTCLITATGADFTIVSSNFSGWNALIEMIW